MAEENTQIRKSKITKFIERKYRMPVQYEMLTISIAYEEEIEWKDIDERSLKSKGITQKLLNDFRETKKDVFLRLSLDKSTANNSFVVDKDGKSTPVPTVSNDTIDKNDGKDESIISESDSV